MDLNDERFSIQIREEGVFLTVAPPAEDSQVVQSGRFWTRWRTNRLLSTTGRRWKKRFGRMTLRRLRLGKRPIKSRMRKSM